MSPTEYICQETLISEEELAPLVERLFEKKHYKKYDTLQKAGSNEGRLYYVEQGLLRIFYEKNRKDITQSFFIEQMFYFPVENIYFDSATPIQLEALEDCVVWEADFREVERVVNEHQELERLMRLLLVSAIQTLREQLYAIKFQSAQERYELLLKKYPQILLHAPLGHIASLLGITQQTLSVIRKN